MRQIDSKIHSENNIRSCVRHTNSTKQGFNIFPITKERREMSTQLRCFVCDAFQRFTKHFEIVGNYFFIKKQVKWKSTNVHFAITPFRNDDAIASTKAQSKLTKEAGWVKNRSCQEKYPTQKRFLKCEDLYVLCESVHWSRVERGSFSSCKVLWQGYCTLKGSKFWRHCIIHWRWSSFASSRFTD